MKKETSDFIRYLFESMKNAIKNRIMLPDLSSDRFTWQHRHLVPNCLRTTNQPQNINPLILLPIFTACFNGITAGRMNATVFSATSFGRPRLLGPLVGAPTGCGLHFIEGRPDQPYPNVLSNLWNKRNSNTNLHIAAQGSGQVAAWRRTDYQPWSKAKKYIHNSKKEN
jgi:hypothetical protein